ncbi:formamidopyrimidine-DNA glycosylase [candidate division KSB1 bacterium]|nr:formamidopyrimidine-DNA glycosylase [candidate division KSB1 bacterium]MBL7094131.1 formamidopyrimidine-DNA glycosylase [candidate division KSB1 bacterium]
MPEYPDITIYIERLEAFLIGQTLQDVRIKHPFLLRTFDPPIGSIKGKQIIGFRLMGKRIIFIFPDEYFLIFHLMVAGRFHWKEKGAKITGKIGLAAFDFPNGTLLLNEAGSKKRASLHLIKGKDRLAYFDRGGLEIFEISLAEFHERLVFENHTLKRVLTDPSMFSGIGNAYSDEILHRAKLSPVLLSRKMSNDQIEKLFDAAKVVLNEWTEKLRKETGENFPEKVTAFHENMAVHGKFGKVCPECGTTVQRIRYVSNETNYCPKCQTGGKILADRSLSRLLKSDWPKSIEAMEEMNIKMKK